MEKLSYFLEMSELLELCKLYLIFYFYFENLLIFLCILLSEDRTATEFLLEGFLGLGFTTLVEQELQLLDTSADPHPSYQQQKPSNHK